jgi:hypothetical protein
MLLQALDKLQHEWEGAELGVLEYRDTGTYIIKVRAPALTAHSCAMITFQHAAALVCMYLAHLICRTQAWDAYASSEVRTHLPAHDI